MRTTRETWLRIGPCRLAALGAGAVALSLLCGPATAQPGSGETKTVEGVVKRMTTAPQGEADGAVLDDGTVIHWPPHLAERFTAVADKGDRIKVVGRVETGPGGDTRLEVRSVTNVRTRTSRENDDPPPPPDKPRKPGKPAKPAPPPPPEAGRRADAEVKTVRGTVRRMTTAPKGEVDGAVLDDGTVIHWPPHLADRFTAIVARGDKLRVTGRMETGPMGDSHLEVQAVTNTDSGASRESGAAPAGRGRVDDGPGDLERRLRAVEERLDRLTRELERRRDR